MSTLPLHADHARLFEHNRFVYPVLSRRSRRHLDRREPEPRQDLQLRLHLLPGRSHAARAKRGSSRSTRLLAELRTTLDLVASGAIYEHRKFRDVPAAPPAPERHRLLRRRRADDVQELRRDHRAVRRGEARCRIATCEPSTLDPRPSHPEDGAHHQRQHVPSPARPARPGDSRRRTTAKSGPSSKPAPTSTTSSSSARRFPSGRFWTTSPPPPACGRS